MENGKLQINIKSETANILIEKISDAIGWVVRPYQIRRIARAEADADITRALTKIEIDELTRRALGRVVIEETKKQDNMESIISKALPQLEDNANPKEIDDDWITNFFDKCRLISGEEMQALWAKVLSGEANSPGKYSKRTVNFLASLDTSEASLFANLCGFGWFIGEVVPLIYDSKSSIYLEHDITFNSLTHLDEIGLLSFGHLVGYKRLNFPKRIQIFYYGIPIIIEFSKDNENDLDIGTVILSKVGQELAPICGAKPVPGFFDYVINRWINQELTLSSPYPLITK